MMYRLSALTLLAIASASAAKQTATPQITFNKQVLPILQENCQGCHRPGEAAPMSFLTYKETRPWAKAIKEAVLVKRMPPWFADPHVGKFANDRSLEPAEIETLVKWAETGAAEGNAAEGPPAKQFLEGWNIGKPDLVFQMPVEFEVPAAGTVEYTYFVIPTQFTEDRWVQMAEARPGNRQVVHHVIAFVREPGSKWMAGAKPGVPFVPAGGESSGSSGLFLTSYAPGTVPATMRPGQAKKIPAGSDIVLQMHYTANGKANRDLTQVGVVFAKEPPRQQVLTLAATTRKFAIPPGAADHRVEAQITLYDDATLISMAPHMHLRGKSFQYRLVLPDGETRELLSVPRYSFSWQLSYEPEEPVLLPAGSRIECVATYDNSANNPHNPDPAREVKYGDQSWEEMMFGFFNVAYDAGKRPSELVKKKETRTAADD